MEPSRDLFNFPLANFKSSGYDLRMTAMRTKIMAIFAAAIILIVTSGAAAQTHEKPSTGTVAQGLKTNEIVFTAPRPFNHKSGWFSLAIPGNWSVTDKSDESEMVVSLADPTENGILVVRVYRSGKQYSEAELGALLKTFLNERLGSFDGFSMGEPTSQNDGSVGLFFKYDSVVEGLTYKMNGNAFIEQQNGLLAVLTLILPQDQYEQKKKAALELVNSFKLTGRP